MKVKFLLALAALMFTALAAADDSGVAWDDLNEEQQKVLSRFAAKWQNTIFLIWVL